MIWLVKGFLWLLAQLPERAPYAIALRCAGLWMHLSPSKRHVAEVNLKNCFPQLTDSERDRLLKDSFVHYVCSILETGRNWFWPRDRLQALCDGVENEDVLNETLASGRSILALAPHFGAWEYLGLYLQKYPDVVILYKPPAHKGLAKALLKSRQRGGARMVPATLSGLRELMDHLRSGKHAGVLPDQQPSAGQGRFAPFFGIPALTGVMVPRLVQKAGCLVLFAVSERLQGGRYRVHVVTPDEEVYSPDLPTALAAVNRGVEKCIAINPAQYLWSYKRFRARPDGHSPMYN